MRDKLGNEPSEPYHLRAAHHRSIWWLGVEPTFQRARAGRPLRTLVLVWQGRPCVSLAVQRIAREGDPSSSKVLAIGDGCCLVQARF